MVTDIVVAVLIVALLGLLLWLNPFKDDE